MATDGAASGSGDWLSFFGQALNAGANYLTTQSNNQTAVDVAKAQAGAATAGVATPALTLFPSSGTGGSQTIASSVGGINLSGLMTPLILIAVAALFWKMAT